MMSARSAPPVPAARPKQRVRLAPLLGLRSERVSDHALGGVYMRGGFNVEPKDGEWWTRGGEDAVLRRIGTTRWTHVLTAGENWLLLNPYWALELDSDDPTNGVTNIYDPLATENVTLANGSTAATATAHTPEVGELLLVGSGYTTEVYRVVDATGTDFVLERPYEGASDDYSCRFLPMLAQDTSGANAEHPLTNVQPISPCSAVVFEQLTTHTATAIHASSPAVTAGHRYLIVTSEVGCPVAIDLNGSQPVKRDWFFNTSIGTPARISTASSFGTYAEVYRGRVFVGAAPDAGGRFPQRTFWYSTYGDFLRWHTGVQGQTAGPNYVTLNGPNDQIAAMMNLGDDLIVHRQRSQAVVSGTGAITQPFTVRTIEQGLGIYQTGALLCVRARGAHYIWTERGPAIFDGARVTLIAREAERSLYAFDAIDAPIGVDRVIHDVGRGRLYWVLGEMSIGDPFRHQDATGYGNEFGDETRTGLDGFDYTSARAVFVYDYEHGAGWLEDRAAIWGGGSLIEPGNVFYRAAYFSRWDGTIVRIDGSTYGGEDAGVADASEDAAVEAQVETPWLDFGVIAQKQLTKVEVVLRSAFGSSTGNGRGRDNGSVNVAQNSKLWLRLLVFADMKTSPTGAVADFGKTYTRSEMVALDVGEDALAPTMVVVFTPRAHGRSFKLRFTNALTNAAAVAGYKQAPFRISEIVCVYAQNESDDLRGTMAGEAIVPTAS